MKLESVPTPFLKTAVDFPLQEHQYIPKFCLFSVPAPLFRSAS